MPTEMVPVTISGVFKRTDSDAAAAKYPYIVTLAEAGGDRRMYIFIGHAEATALALSVSGSESLA